MTVAVYRLQTPHNRVDFLNANTNNNNNNNFSVLMLLKLILSRWLTLQIAIKS